MTTYHITQMSSPKRGCGFRKQGGFYLMTDAAGSFLCGRLPQPIVPCECCGRTFSQTRGMEYTTGKALFQKNECHAPMGHCKTCIFTDLMNEEKVGLMWVGAKFYTPDSFRREVAELGISKRIASNMWQQIEVGKTWIALAHPHAIEPSLEELQAAVEDGKEQPTGRPGIFKVFQPRRIEYIVQPTDSPAFLQELYDNGITLVNEVQAAPLFDEPSNLN